MPELATRVASALVLAALAIGAALISPWTFLLLVIAASCVIAWEWGRLTRGDGSDRIAIVQMIGVALALTLVAFGRPALALGALGLTALAIAAASAGTQSLPWALAGLAYAAFPGAALIWLRSDAALGAVAVLYLLAVASTTDTAAYATGRLIGGPKLAPRISPHKTWSGFAAGLLGACPGRRRFRGLSRRHDRRLARFCQRCACACLPNRRLDRERGEAPVRDQGHERAHSRPWRVARPDRQPFARRGAGRPYCAARSRQSRQRPADLVD